MRLCSEVKKGEIKKKKRRKKEKIENVAKNKWDRFGFVYSTV